MITRRRQKQRGHNSGGRKEGIDDREQKIAQPIDEHEQSKIVEQLRADSSKQVHDLATAVTLVCYFAAGSTVLVSAATAFELLPQQENRDDTPNNLLAVVYPVYSAVMHMIAAYISGRAKLQVPKDREGGGGIHASSSSQPARTAEETKCTKVQMMGMIGVSIQLCLVVLLYMYDRGDIIAGGDGTVSLVQLLGNSLTMLATIFVYRDSFATEESLRELEASKYHFKSL